MAVYLNVGYNDTARPVVLTMVTSNVVTALITPSRSWKIRVSQIPCNEGFTAPPGCLQYFTGQTGVLRSFNFFFDAGSASSARQLSYQDYTICIRQENVSVIFGKFYPKLMINLSQGFKP